jgi:predicted DNA-binding protein (UPF0251 family)
MSTTIASTGTAAPTPELTEAARGLMADFGAKEAAQRLGVSQSALLRIVAGAPVRRGTVALASAAITNHEKEQS